MPTQVNQEFIRPALSATGRLQCPVADRVEWAKGVPLLPDSTVDACISYIFSHSHESQDLGKYFIVCEMGGK